MSPSELQKLADISNELKDRKFKEEHQSDLPEESYRDDRIDSTEEELKLRADIAASFQKIAIDHLKERSERAIEWAKDV